MNFYKVKTCGPRRLSGVEHALFPEFNPEFQMSSKRLDYLICGNVETILQAHINFLLAFLQNQFKTRCPPPTHSAVAQGQESLLQCLHIASSKEVRGCPGSLKSIPPRAAAKMLFMVDCSSPDLAVTLINDTPTFIFAHLASVSLACF